MNLAGMFRARALGVPIVTLFLAGKIELAGMFCSCDSPLMKTYKWTVEFTVSANWVEDGFDLTDERALEMLQSDLGYAYESELGAHVIKAPSREAILKEQGYLTA